MDGTDTCYPRPLVSFSVQNTCAIRTLYVVDQKKLTCRRLDFFSALRDRTHPFCGILLPIEPYDINRRTANFRVLCDFDAVTSMKSDLYCNYPVEFVRPSSPCLSPCVARHSRLCEQPKSLPTPCAEYSHLVGTTDAASRPFSTLFNWLYSFLSLDGPI